MKVLFVNACVREKSRTKILADALLKKIGGEVTEINLGRDLPAPFSEEMLLKRDELVKNRTFDDKMFSYAKMFINADVIVIAAPMWDFSFPAVLKTFIEHVNVAGLVFKYTQSGIQSLCKAKTLYYVTTMGGFNPTDFGFGYIKSLCDVMYGIHDVRLIKAEGLDIVGNDVEAILSAAKIKIDNL